jgi:hypothetical protein
MQITLEFDKGSANPFAELICNLVVNTITDAAMALAPELAGPELMEEFEFDTVCGEMFQET